MLIKFYDAIQHHQATMSLYKFLILWPSWLSFYLTLYFTVDFPMWEWNIPNKLLEVNARSHLTHWGHTSDSHQMPCHKKTKSKLQIPKICQKFKFCNHPYMRHTFWSCLIKCANMKWIWLVLWKIQSGHGFVHRRTDRRTDDVKPVYPFQLCWSGGYNELTQAMRSPCRTPNKSTA